MKQNEYTCAMIADLIPLCAESLCSPESRAAVEAHIETCEHCRKLYEALPEEAEPAAVPDEARTFRKVGKKLRRNRLAAVLLLILLAALLTGLGYLTAGQINKRYDHQSFETVFESLRVRGIIDKMAKGDFSECADVISWEQYNTVFFSDLALVEDRFSEAEKKLTESFRADLGDAKPKKIRVYSEYGYLDARQHHYSVFTTAEVTYDNNRYFEYSFLRQADNGYLCVCHELTADEPRQNLEQGEFSKTLSWYSFPDGTDPKEWLIWRLTADRTDAAYQPALESELKEQFSETCCDRVIASVLAFTERYRIERAICSPMLYDAERKEPYWEMTVEAADSKGTAVLLTRFTSDLSGLLPQDAAQNTVYTDGCTPELAEALRTLF